MTRTLSRVSARSACLSGRHRITRANRRAGLPGYCGLAIGGAVAVRGGEARPTGYCGLARRSLQATTTSIRTVCRSRAVSSRCNNSVCSMSTASVKPLKVRPSATSEPPAGPRAPRCRLLSRPRRRPWPHSTASVLSHKLCQNAQDFLLSARHDNEQRPNTTRGGATQPTAKRTSRLAQLFVGQDTRTTGSRVCARSTWSRLRLRSPASWRPPGGSSGTNATPPPRLAGLTETVRGLGQDPPRGRRPRRRRRRNREQRRGGIGYSGPFRDSTDRHAPLER